MNANIFFLVIMFISTYPVLLILYYTQLSAVEEMKGTLFGIRCSSDWMPDDERTRLIVTYKKQLKRLLFIMAPIPLVSLFVPYMSVSTTIWMTWLLSAIVLFFLPYAQGFNRVKELKAAHSLPADQTGVTFHELKQAGTIRTLRLSDLLPLILCNVGIVLFSLFYFRGQRLQSYWTVLITFALCALLLSAAGISMDRMKTRVISRDSDININFTRAGKKIWKQFWLTLCLLMTASDLLFLLCLLLPGVSDRTAFWLCMAESLLMCIALIGLLISAMNKKQKLERLYEKDRDDVFDQDDKYWIGGLLYYNPKDRHTMVEKRVGIGTTCNLATPFGKGLTLFSGLCLMPIPLACVWLMLEEFTPISLSLQEEALVAEHIGTCYNIPLEEILSVTLMEELPHSTKVYGTNMSGLEKGQFRNSADGRVEECLNPLQGVFLRVETAEQIYYLGSYDETDTRRVYEQLCGELTDIAPSLP